MYNSNTYLTKAMKDYYKVLGIGKQASKEDIKKAFRNLAHKYHPDKRGGDDKKFKEISEAYSVLSDDKKRSEYDTFGQYTGGARQGGAGFEGFGDFDFSNFTGRAGFEGVNFNDLGDIFGDIFGGRETRRNRGRDISIDLELSFEESILGVERKVLITKTSLCDICGGKGGQKGTTMRKCEKCNGKGHIREARRSFFGTISTTRVCDICGGAGEVPKEACYECGGHGVLRRQEEIAVQIPPGIDNGEMIRMTGKGEAVRGGLPGDLYIKIHVEPHKTLRREGHNLVTNISIKLSEAILGGERKIDTLDGQLTLTIPAGVSFGEILRLRGRGVPIERNKRGDLLIKVSIIIPKKLSREARVAVETLGKEGL